MNHFIRVELVWSYNLMGGLTDDVENPLTMELIDTMYNCLSRYLVAKHNFILDHNTKKFTDVVEGIHTDLPSQMYINYCIYYFDNLFLMLRPGMAGIGYITGIELATTDTCELEAILIRTN